MEKKLLAEKFIKDSIFQRTKSRVRRTVGKRMFAASASVVLGDMGRTFYSATLIGQKNVAPVLDTVVHHVGDFTWFAFAELLFHQTLFSGIKNPKIRRNASLAGGVGLLAMAEVSQVNDLG